MMINNSYDITSELSMTDFDPHRAKSVAAMPTAINIERLRKMNCSDSEDGLNIEIASLKALQRATPQLPKLPS